MFVTLEGLDGSGTTSLLEEIKREYDNSVTTSEPSDLRYGRMVRENLSDESTNELADFYVFMADRVHHIDEIVRPADEAGKLVVSDRYADSTRAYQPIAMTDAEIFDSQFQAKDFIEHTMAPWDYEPDLTIYIDISVDTALDRAAGDEKYEKRQFLERVKENYDALVDSEEFGHRIVRVDGEQSKEEVARSALGKIDVVAPDRL
jgi:dTMP kinase